MKILVTGATGQIGSELVPYLRNKYGQEDVIANLFSEKLVTDQEIKNGPSENFDALDPQALTAIVKKYRIEIIYNLVGILSARGEQDPANAWRVNMETLRNVLDVSVATKIKKIFWPSSIAVFGPTTPRDMTPQQTVLEPQTMYGVTKVAGELLVNYYVKKYGLDIRSLRLPGIISYKTKPGGGTTDYAVAMFYEALLNKKYTCFVRPDTVLPMMYMDDAIQAIDQLMSTSPDKLSIHTSYNLTALSFTAAELAQEIAKQVPGFVCHYQPDFRQAIADSWPKTIDDEQARKDWGWQPQFTLAKLITEMLTQLKTKLKIPSTTT